MKRRLYLAVIIALFIGAASANAQEEKPYRPGIRYQQRQMRPGMRDRLQQRRQPMNRYPALGVQFGHDFDLENYMIGANMDVPVGRFWSLVPSFDYMLTGDDAAYDRWQFNADLIFHPRPRGYLYFGGGLATEYLLPEQADNETNFGGSALVGLEFGQQLPMRAFVQTRWTFLDETYFSVQGGVKLVLR